MNPHAAEVPEPVLLIIADISGYTRYMTANAKTLAHSQTIITELVTAIIKQIELPLEVAKLEGDAVFLYCRKQGSANRWPEMKRVIGDKLFTFFRMFSEKVGELSRSTTCTCNACTHIDKLRLKVVVHSGEALFHSVLHFVELAGVDVIIVHRLLKNSVDADQYLLLTDAARHDVDFSEPIHLSPGSEHYDDIGQIKTLVYLPDGARTASSASFATDVHADKAVRAPITFSQSWKLFFKLWLSSFRGTSARGESDASSAGRIAYALFMLVIAPIYLPVGTVTAFIHSRKQPKPSHDHDHKPDGSCCSGN
jgi:hypothetical protein